MTTVERNGETPERDDEGLPCPEESRPEAHAYSEKDLLRAMLRGDFYSFVQKVFETVSPGDAFSRNWSIEAVCHAIDKVIRGENTRLIINIPPRNLKSICASVALPAFLLGHDPTKRIICVSYSDDLAKKFSNDCRAVMKSDWYQRLFPKTVIDRTKDTETEVQTTARGYRLATSVGGTLTGRGGDFIIIDDPIKPQDAQSKSVREKTVQWYDNTLLSRLDDKQRGAILLVMQRLHMDDLAAYLLSGGGFEHLCLPAIADTKETIQLGDGRVHVREVDDVLDPVREPRLALEQLRNSMTPLVFSAQYQQRPIPLAGNIIKRDWIKFYEGGSIPWEEGEYHVTSWDTAMKSSELADYSVGTVWTVQERGSRIYLIDCVRGRFEFPELIEQAVKLYHRWGFSRPKRYHNLVIEDKGSGTSLIQALKARKIYTYPHRLEQHGDKIMRLEAQAVSFANGNVYFPAKAPWLDELLAELLAFPGVKHDDQVDSISQALACISHYESRRIVPGRYHMWGPGAPTIA